MKHLPAIVTLFVLFSSLRVVAFQTRSVPDANQAAVSISQEQPSSQQKTDGLAEPGKLVDLPRHWLVFTQHSDVARKNYDVWKIAADGTQLSSVVILPGHQSQVAISRDGNRLVYNSFVDGKYDLFVRGFNGGTPENVTAHPASDNSPSWSPDGTRIVFTSDRDHEKPELYILNLESKKLKRLTDNDFYDSGTDWSPDGKTILFTRFFPAEDGSKQGGQGRIFEIDVESGVERQLTDLSGYCGGVNYSPDGKRIAFHRTGERSEIWVMNADGSNAKAITDTFLDEYSPAWSPDGNWIAYTSGTGSDSYGAYDLWMMLPDGSRQHVISKAANTQMNPRWRFGEFYCR